VANVNRVLYSTSLYERSRASNAAVDSAVIASGNLIVMRCLTLSRQAICLCTVYFTYPAKHETLHATIDLEKGGLLPLLIEGLSGGAEP
jgi:hypothetical protein